MGTRESVLSSGNTDIAQWLVDVVHALVNRELVYGLIWSNQCCARWCHCRQQLSAHSLTHSLPRGIGQKAGLSHSLKRWTNRVRCPRWVEGEAGEERPGTRTSGRNVCNDGHGMHRADASFDCRRSQHRGSRERVETFPRDRVAMAGVVAASGDQHVRCGDWPVAVRNEATTIFVDCVESDRVISGRLRKRRPDLFVSRGDEQREKWVVVVGESREADDHTVHVASKLDMVEICTVKVRGLEA